MIRARAEVKRNISNVAVKRIEHKIVKIFFNVEQGN